MRRQKKEKKALEKENISPPRDCALKAKSYKKKHKIKKSEHIRGRWSEDEHNQFVKNFIMYGRDWAKVIRFIYIFQINSIINTRNIYQIRSHAQKFFEILDRKFKDQKLNLNTDGIINEETKIYQIHNRNKLLKFKRKNLIYNNGNIINNNLQIAIEKGGNQEIVERINENKMNTKKGKFFKIEKDEQCKMNENNHNKECSQNDQEKLYIEELLDIISKNKNFISSMNDENYPFNYIEDNIEIWTMWLYYNDAKECIEILKKYNSISNLVDYISCIL